jgi:hypothetical protein
VQTAEHATVLAEAEIDKAQLKLRQSLELLETERSKCRDFKAASEQKTVKMRSACPTSCWTGMYC